jgi:hypothetical protein
MLFPNHEEFMSGQLFNQNDQQDQDFKTLDQSHLKKEQECF